MMAIVLEAPEGHAPLVTDWLPSMRPWRFLHADGRYYDAAYQDKGIWTYRTLDPQTPAPTITALLTRGPEAAIETTIEILAALPLPSLLTVENNEYQYQHRLSSTQVMYWRPERSTHA